MFLNQLAIALWRYESILFKARDSVKREPVPPLLLLVKGKGAIFTISIYSISPSSPAPTSPQILVYLHLSLVILSKLKALSPSSKVFVFLAVNISRKNSFRSFTCGAYSAKPAERVERLLVCHWTSHYSPNILPSCYTVVSLYVHCLYPKVLASHKKELTNAIYNPCGIYEIISHDSCDIGVDYRNITKII